MNPSHIVVSYQPINGDFRTPGTGNIVIIFYPRNESSQRIVLEKIQALDLIQQIKDIYGLP